MSDSMTPGTGATPESTASAQAERENRVRHALEELGIAVLASTMVIKAIEDAPRTLFPAQTTSAQLSDLWRAASLLLRCSCSSLSTAGTRAISAVRAMIAHS